MSDGLDVLVVDHDPVTVALVTHILGRAGAAVRVLTSGGALLDLMDGPDGETVDAVLMDLRLPDLDGRDVVRRLRARGGWQAGVPVVVLTADRGAGIEDTCLAAGYDAVLAKPADSATLVATLTGLTGRVDAGSAPLVDPDVLLDRVGDPELAKITIEVFLDGAAGRAAAFTTFVATAEPDRDELHRAAHSLKSAADLVGAGPLTVSCRELEAAALIEPVEGLRVRVEEVVGLLSATGDALRTLPLGGQ